MNDQHALSAREIRQQMASDPHRPQYHFQPPSNWMNDPNGLIHFQGIYHLFYQHNPYGPLHANMHWGHAASQDLVHWQDLPIALAPTPEGPDKDGCWSGCAVNNDGVPTLVYTGVWPESQNIATSTDMIEWTKHPNNPVVPAPPPDLDVTGFRDPCVWREGNTWYMVIGSGIRNVGGTVFLYRSPDLVNWEYLHPLHTGDWRETGEMWECPSFFALGDAYVLVFSKFLFHPVEYFTGSYQNHRFEPTHHDFLDYSGLFYAPQTFADETGRRLMFGWIREARSDDLVETAGWSGVQSVPRVLVPRPDGRLGVGPVPELQTLRGKHVHRANLTVAPGTSVFLGEIQGNSLEILVTFEAGSTGQFGLTLLRSPGSEEETTLTYDRATQSLTIDRSRSCAKPDGVDVTAHSAPLHLAPGEALTLHVLVDHSVIEVFANGHTALTSRVYPTRPDSVGLDIFARGSASTVKQMDVWQLGSIW